MGLDLASLEHTPAYQAIAAIFQIHHNEVQMTGADQTQQAC